MVNLEDTEATMERDEDEDEADLTLDSGKTTDDMLDHRSGIRTSWGVPFFPHLVFNSACSIN